MYKGQLEGFPKEVVEKMLERQVEQGNPKDVSVFEKDNAAGKSEKGFDWHESVEKSLFWYYVIIVGKFDIFFEKYPKSEPDANQLTFPREMMCWEYHEECAEVDLVLAHFPNRHADGKYIGDRGTWMNAKEISQPTEKERKAEELIKTANELLALAEKLKSM